MRILSDDTKVLDPGEAVPENAVHVRMSKDEFEAATVHMKWGFDDPDGKFKADDPIGPREYLRRRSGEVKVEEVCGG